MNASKPRIRPGGGQAKHLAAAALLMVLGAALSIPAAALEPTRILVPDATQLRLRLEHPVSSASATVNLPLIFKVTEDVVLEGRTVIAKDAEALGTVTRAQHRKGFGRRGKLEFTIAVVEAVDGQKLRLDASQSLRGKDLYGTAGVVTILTGPFGVFVKGKDVEVAAGTEYTVYTAGERRVLAGSGQTGLVQAP